MQTRRKTQQSRANLANAIEGPAPRRRQIGDQRMEHVSYKVWCDLARAAGWDGKDDADGLRAYCEPEEAATITIHASLKEAKAAALATWVAAPNDSAFGAILIFHETLRGDADPRGCPPTWDAETNYEITSDGDCLESAS